MDWAPADPLSDLFDKFLNDCEFEDAQDFTGPPARAATSIDTTGHVSSLGLDQECFPSYQPRQVPEVSSLTQATYFPPPDCPVPFPESSFSERTTQLPSDNNEYWSSFDQFVSDFPNDFNLNHEKLASEGGWNQITTYSDPMFDLGLHQNALVDPIPLPKPSDPILESLIAHPSIDTSTPVRNLDLNPESRQMQQISSYGDGAVDPEDLALSPDYFSSLPEAPGSPVQNASRDSGARPSSRNQKAKRPRGRPPGATTRLYPHAPGNSRSDKFITYKASDYYDALEECPAKWGPFSYTHEGELELKRKYSVEEIQQYLDQHPLHAYLAQQGYQESGLILWIQRSPADSKARYSTESSNRCRFEDCPATYGCINVGQYRVAFDEQSYKEGNHDPHHNAGYVHLYCLEKFLNFPEICTLYDVRPDNRNLPLEPKGKNRMRFESDKEVNAVTEFVESCRRGDRSLPHGYPDRSQGQFQHEGTLVHTLSLVKVANQKARVQKKREERGEKNSMISKHLGNLELETPARDKTRTKAFQRTKDPVYKLSPEKRELAKRQTAKKFADKTVSIPDKTSGKGTKRARSKSSRETPQRLGKRPRHSQSYHIDQSDDSDDSDEDYDDNGDVKWV
ncbi:hypothetical protein MMC09_000910 [Bachmanniomyces sp. S44760]|nr:hypothetical protein [Bachmanniomyces sp. S44760]